MTRRALARLALLAALGFGVLSAHAPHVAAEPAATPPTNDVGPVDWGDDPVPPVRHAPSAFGKTYPAGTQAARDWAWRRLGTGQFRCLDSLWHHESGWRVLAHNPSSGAHGIPQALPGSRMASAGPDWRTNPMTQVRWGLRYIGGRYGSACNAEAHRVRWGWY